MSLSQSARAALVVAHPSHELRVHGWLEETRPYVCVLTDGGGRSGDVRLPRTSEVVAHAGARQGTIYGRLSDLEVYSAILNRDADLFAGLVEELARAFAEEKIEYVVGDAAEGYSVTHDICRIMIGAAVDFTKVCAPISLSRPGNSFRSLLVRVRVDPGPETDSGSPQRFSA